MSVSEPLDLLGELNRLEALRDPSRHDNGQRRFQRFLIRGDAELHPMDPASVGRLPIEIKLRDIARAGLGFVCDQPLPVDSGWRVNFLHHGYTIGTQAMVIRHCHEVRPGVYLVGGQFIIETGLMALLGVDPAAIDGADNPREQIPDGADFLDPNDVD